MTDKKYMVLPSALANGPPSLERGGGRGGEGEHRGDPVAIQTEPFPIHVKRYHGNKMTAFDDSVDYQPSGGLHCNFLR